MASSAHWIEKHTRDEVIEHFDKHGVAYSAVFDMEDAFRDIQYRAREAMVRVPDADLGEAIVQNVVPKFSATPGSVDFLGRKLGAHNEDDSTAASWACPKNGSRN